VQYRKTLLRNALASEKKNVFGVSKPHSLAVSAVSANDVVAQMHILRAGRLTRHLTFVHLEGVANAKIVSMTILKVVRSKKTHRRVCASSGKSVDVRIVFMTTQKVGSLSQHQTCGSVTFVMMQDTLRLIVRGILRAGLTFARSSAL